MGISTYQSYCGAQIFDAVGLNSDFIGKYFKGTHTQIEGIGLYEVAVETCNRHAAAFRAGADFEPTRWMWAVNMRSVMRGERHVWDAGYNCGPAACGAGQPAGEI